MKLISFKKLITFKEGGRVVCEDLAKNQTKLCQKTEKHYVLEGFDKQTNWYYRVYWSLDGTFKYVKLQKIQKTKVKMTGLQKPWIWKKTFILLKNFLC